MHFERRSSNDRLEIGSHHQHSQVPLFLFMLQAYLRYRDSAAEEGLAKRRSPFGSILSQIKVTVTMRRCSTSFLIATNTQKLWHYPACASVDSL